MNSSGSSTTSKNLLSNSGDGSAKFGMNPLAATIAFCMSRVNTAVSPLPAKLGTSISPVLTNAGIPFKFGINCGRSPAFAPPTPREIARLSLLSAGIYPFAFESVSGSDFDFDPVEDVNIG